MAVLPATIVEEDLKAGTIHVHPTVGYIAAASEFGGSAGLGTTTIKGFGATLQANYSFSSHIGISLAGLGFSGKGTYTPASLNPSGVAGPASARGRIISNMVIVDFFSGNDFRMPIVFGPNYEWLDTETSTAGDLLAVSLRSVGWSAGFSPRFNFTKLLRIEPFFIANITFEAAKATCNAAVTNCPSYSRELIPVAGINFEILPLGLSFYYDFSSMLTKNSASYLALGIHF